jgi:hypothetical protein
MSWMGRAGDENEVSKVADKPDELDEVLREFRLGVHAWSEAALSRPRTVAESAPHRVWRLALGWSLGCALLAGGVSGGLYEQHQRRETARVVAAKAAEQQRLAAQERARQEEEELLAKVDRDVSREVPSAMEPLARLMAEDESQ